MLIRSFTDFLSHINSSSIFKYFKYFLLEKCSLVLAIVYDLQSFPQVLFWSDLKHLIIVAALQCARRNKNKTQPAKKRSSICTASV